MCIMIHRGSGSHALIISYMQDQQQGKYINNAVLESFWAEKKKVRSYKGSLKKLEFSILLPPPLTLTLEK